MKTFVKKLGHIELILLIQCVPVFLSPKGFADDGGQSASDSDVLVSSSANLPVSGQDGIVIHKNNGSPAPNTPENNGANADASNTSTDEIVTKATDAVMFQMTANLKMTQDQISAVRPIIEDNVIKVRGLQQSLQSGSIDGKTMYDQRQQLTVEEDQKLSRILSADQMKTWLIIQSEG